MAPIGFTTGSLYRSDISFDRRIGLYHSLGADAIELGLATPDQLFGYKLSDQTIAYLSKFKFVSVHAPWKEVTYDSDSTTQRIIDSLRSICEQLPIKGLVLHPDTIRDLDILNQSGLPFLLENMDRRKPYGTHPEHIEDLKRESDFGFVFDVQHAYEHDPTMQLAREMIDIMGDRLKHMHVSGHSESEIHVPTYCADNREAIVEILKLGIDVPKILEGILLEDIENLARSELEFIRTYET